jgi:hypothetical protein
MFLFSDQCCMVHSGPVPQQQRLTMITLPFDRRPKIRQGVEVGSERGQVTHGFARKAENCPATAGKFQE